VSLTTIGRFSRLLKITDQTNLRGHFDDGYAALTDRFT